MSRQADDFYEKQALDIEGMPSDIHNLEIAVQALRGDIKKLTKINKNLLEIVKTHQEAIKVITGLE